MPDSTPHPLDQLAERGRDDAPALVLRERCLIMPSLRKRVGLLLAAGWRAGAGPGARRQLGGKRRIDLLAAARRCSCAGVVHVPINPLLKRAQVAHILADSGAVLLMGTKGLVGLARSRRRAASVVVFWRKAEASRWPKSRTVTMQPSAHDPDALAVILYTSGSTGRPKGVMLSHEYVAGRGQRGALPRHGGGRCHAGGAPAQFRLWPEPAALDLHAGGCVVPLDYLFPRDVAKACASSGDDARCGAAPVAATDRRREMACGGGRGACDG